MYKTAQKGFAHLFALLLVLALLLGAATFFVKYLQSTDNNRVLSVSSTSQSLYVNAAAPVGTFSGKMLGVAFVNWEHAWNKPYVNEVPGLVAAMKEAKVGIIRYAGGNWANYVGFDPTKKAPQAYTDWLHKDMTYSFNYGTEEIASVQRAAQALNADVIVQVNISNNDPDMWASMVQFTNFGNDPVTGQPKYPIKYWELGNELDIACNGGDSKVCVNPTDYSNRAVAYQKAMLAIDPSIKFLGAGQASAVQQIGTNSLLSSYFIAPFEATKSAGHTMDGATYHWYMQCGSNTLADILRYRYYNADGSPLNPPTLWNNAYSRSWADVIPAAIKSQVVSKYPNTVTGITELNFNACNYDSVFNGNHINALWLSDVIGRLAYNGLDFSTVYTGYGTQGYSLFYPDNDNAPTKIFARPSYYAFLMYAKYFGDQIVQSTSYKNDDISIWASKSSTDNDKLFLRVTNMTASAITVPVVTDNYTSASGMVYTMKSDNPTSTDAVSNTYGATTKINGVKVDAMNASSTFNTIQPIPLAVNGNSFTYTFPAYTSTAIVLSGMPGTITPPPSGGGGIDPAPTSDPISFTSIKIANTKTTSVDIVWTTNVPTAGFVEYGATYGVYDNVTAIQTDPTNTHVTSLKGLMKNKRYYYRVHALSADAQEEKISSVAKFKTAVK